MQMSYREGLREGLKYVLETVQESFVLGEDVAAYGGAYAVTKGFLDLFGPGKIIDAPLSENGFTGLGIGSALAGMRPIIEIMTVNFSLLAFDQIINSAAILRFMSGGEIGVPLVIRMTTGGGRQLGAQHSNSFEGWLAHIPGLKILAPATVADARTFIRFAIDDPDPVIIFEHAVLLNKTEDVSILPDLISPYKAQVRKEGDRLSVITYGGMLDKCLEASQEIEGVEVIDLRCLRPLDENTIFQSIKKTHRVLIVDEGWRSGSLSAEIAARICEFCFYDLDAPIFRLCRREVPAAYAKHFEDASLPQVNDIKLKIKELLS